MQQIEMETAVGEFDRFSASIEIPEQRTESERGRFACETCFHVVYEPGERSRTVILRRDESRRRNLGRVSLFPPPSFFCAWELMSEV